MIQLYLYLAGANCYWFMKFGSRPKILWKFCVFFECVCKQILDVPIYLLVTSENAADSFVVWKEIDNAVGVLMSHSSWLAEHVE